MNEEKTFDQIIGQNLKDLRMQRGMSLKATGGALPIPKTLQQIRKYEEGTNRISAETLYDLSRILQCPIISLFKGIKKFETEIWDYMRQSTDQKESVVVAVVNLLEVMAASKPKTDTLG